MTEANLEAPTLKERILYHELHPFKLATDWSLGVMAARALAPLRANCVRIHARQSRHPPDPVAGQFEFPL